MQRRIDLGPLDRDLRRLSGQAGSVVAQQGAQGFVVATFDDDLRQDLGHRGAGRDSAQMFLPVFADNTQQVFIGQDRRGGQDGRGDGGIVIGEVVNQGVGGVGCPGEPGGQFGANRGLHICRKAGQNRAIEGVLGGGACRSPEKMLGQFAQQGAALLARPLLGHGDQLRQTRCH